MQYKCINCLKNFSIEELTTEHVIASSLGGCLELEVATCEVCNNQKINKFDSFLANDFPPTVMARTDLKITSTYRKHSSPKTTIEIHDKRLGIIEAELNTPDALNKINFKKSVKKIGNDLYAWGQDFESALASLSKARKKKILPAEIDETGIISATKITTRQINWDFAKLAAAKILYCYILLELGDEILELKPMETLRNYFSQAFVASKLSVDVFIGCSIKTDEGDFEVPSHHHVIMFDSEDVKPNFVCLFGLFWFKINIDLSELSPHGRLIGIDSRKRQIIESCTKHLGVWRFRTSHHFGWSRKLGGQC